MKRNETYREEADGLVMDGFRMFRAGLVWSGELLVDALRFRMTTPADRLDPPESEPVEQLPQATPVAPAATVQRVGGPATLRELGVPGSLAAEMELVLELMGHNRDGRITGYVFRTPDGVVHPLRSETVRAPDAHDRAA